MTTFSVLLNKVVSHINKSLYGGGLRERCARGAMALGIGTFVERGMRGARNMILARILAPDEFGLMAIVMVAAMAFEAFTEVGIKQSVIHNKHGADTNYLNVAWWMQAIRGLGLFVVATLVAPWISSFYDKPELLKLLQVAFLAILFRGFVSPRAHVLEKQYKFGRAVFLVQGSGILGTITTIVLAFMIRNVWALVAGFVVEAGILCLLSFVLVPFLPRFRIDGKCLGELMKFARGMFGLPILAMLSFQMDVLVLGKVATGEQLGMYYLAIALVNIPMDFFSRVVAPILLPVFAEKQSDTTAVHAIVLKITKIIAVFGLPFIVFLASCAAPILSIAYGSQYAAVAVPFGLLCLCVFVRAQSIVFGQLYIGLGRPHLHRRFNIIRVIILVSLIYPGVVLFGLSGAAAVVLLGNFVALCFQVMWARRLTELKFSSYTRCYAPGLLLVLPVIATVSFLRLFGIDSPIPTLIAGVFAFIATFVGGIFILNRTNRLPTIKKESDDKLDYLSSAGVSSV